DAVVRALRAEGVRTEHIARGGSRVGIYFTETGASQRASTVIYDRAHSAISEMPEDAVAWDLVMAGVALFHVTGITPALGDREAAATGTGTLGPPMVAITLRESLSASDNGWSAVLWDGASQTLHESQRYTVRLVDRIGGGDSFAAGLIYGLVTGRPHAEALRF